MSTVRIMDIEREKVEIAILIIKGIIKSKSLIHCRHCGLLFCGRAYLLSPPTLNLIVTIGETFQNKPNCVHNSFQNQLTANCVLNGNSQILLWRKIITAMALCFVCLFVLKRTHKIATCFTRLSRTSYHFDRHIIVFIFKAFP